MFLSTQSSIQSFEINSRFSSQEEVEQKGVNMTGEPLFKSSSHNMLMKLLDMKSEEEEEMVIDDDLENSPTFAPKSRSRRNLMLCETSVTVADSTINNLPKSPIARRELWPQASSRSGKATPESERESTRRDLDHLLKRQLPKVDQ